MPTAPAVLLQAKGKREWAQYQYKPVPWGTKFETFLKPYQ